MKVLMLLVVAALGFTADAAFFIGASAAISVVAPWHQLGDALPVALGLDFVAVIGLITAIYFRARFLQRQGVMPVVQPPGPRRQPR